MIEFDKFTLDNGLKVIVHKDITTPLAAVNILYNIGAKDEDPEQTGFAHLFEHLMFGGSVNIPNYDELIKKGTNCPIVFEMSISTMNIGGFEGVTKVMTYAYDFPAMSESVLESEKLPRIYRKQQIEKNKQEQQKKRSLSIDL